MIYEVALRAALRGAEVVIAARASASFTVATKTSQSDLVTTADRETEQAILGEIRAAFPYHAVLAEESAPRADAQMLAGPLWIVDPIDGTTNFIHGLPMVGISIAFALNGIVQVGVVHCPFLGETFAAIRGGGATLNNVALRTPDTPPLSEALIAVGFPSGGSRAVGNQRLAKAFERIYTGTRDARRFGAASIDICYVAVLAHNHDAVVPLFASTD